MITTLRTGALSLSSVQYKFDASGRLTIKITTSAAHLLHGDINITLANVLDINIYKNDGSLEEDFFNKTFLFSRTGATTLEYSEQINSGIAQSESFATLVNNGSAITATVANSSISVENGDYIVKLVSSDTEFSTSQVSVIEKNLIDNLDGVEQVFYRVDNLSVSPAQYTLNEQVFSFQTNVLFSIKNNNAGVTNIPLIITKI